MNANVLANENYTLTLSNLFYYLKNFNKNPLAVASIVMSIIPSLQACPHTVCGCNLSYLITFHYNT